MSRRGRPALFDRAKAVESAMELFWARGYEGATLEELQAAMGGISPPSFYNAFGSKEALFAEVVELYVSTVAATPACALQQGKTARDGIAAMLRESLDSFSTPGKPQGCLLLSGAMNCKPANNGSWNHLRELRQGTSDMIEGRLQRAVAEGELSPETDIAAIAEFYTTVIHGLSVRAGDRASRAKLIASVECAMMAWDGLLISRQEHDRPESDSGDVGASKNTRR